MNDEDKCLEKYPDELLDEELDHGSDLRSFGWLQNQFLTLQLQLHFVRSLELHGQQLCKTSFIWTWINVQCMELRAAGQSAVKGTA